MNIMGFTSTNMSANALVRNDDCHSALDVARIKGHTNVVRAIEVSLLRQNCKFSEFCYGCYKMIIWLNF